jgi:hypothetical protein
MDLDLETKEREREEGGGENKSFFEKKNKDLDFILDAHLILC